MTAPNSLAWWSFAAAGAASVAVAALMFALLSAAVRHWPAMAASRRVWALAQAAVAAVFLLSLVPSSHSLGILPAVRLPTASEAGDAVAPQPGFLHASRSAHTEEAEGALPVRTPGLAAEARPRSAARLLRWLPAAWLSAYLAGLLWTLGRLARAQLGWRSLRLSARSLSPAALRVHAAFAPAHVDEIAQHGLRVLETDAAISPMLFGLLRPRLLLPVHLRELDTAQQRMIIEHELTHWRRRDTRWLAASAALEILFWFNRPLHWLGRRLRWAVELGCDNAVLAGRPQRERHTYAAALVAQLKRQPPVCASGLAFGNLAVSERIRRMRDPDAAPVPAIAKLGITAAVGALALASLVMQPAFGWDPAPQVRVPSIASLATGEPTEPWRYPLDRVRVTSLYGVTSELLPKGHKGIDFAAKRGTPVHAVAAGSVVTAATDERYGNYVLIDHGHGRSSLSIHLDSAAVQAGDQVQAGQVIGAVGATGFATGPHLHLEYRQDGQRRDPQLMFADLDAHATSRAITRRNAQRPAAQTVQE